MKKIAFTGGGSIGHVAVNLALIPYFEAQGYQTIYLGSKKGIEKQMIQEATKTPYFSVSSGKIRRYFSWQNFIDPFKVLKGIWDAYRILKREKPQLLFSKGGFVSVPVCIAARLLHIPVLLHESDVTPGLANKLNSRFADHIFTTFSETLKYLPEGKAEAIGAVIRQELWSGDKQKGYQLTGLDTRKPILLVMGGSLGSQLLNDTLRQQLPTLLEQFSIIHLTGKNMLDDSIQHSDYVQYEFLTDTLPHILAISDYVVSRAGANAIFEFLALEKPMLLIPLGTNQSRGDQILNARSFEKQGYALVLQEEALVDNQTVLTNTLEQLVQQTANIKQNMATYQLHYTIEDIYQKIIAYIPNQS